MKCSEMHIRRMPGSLFYNDCYKEFYAYFTQLSLGFTPSNEHILIHITKAVYKHVIKMTFPIFSAILTILNS